MSAPIRSIAIVGDGIAGWLAAAACARRLPDVTVTVVPVADLAPSLADLFGGTPPSVRDFHADIGLREIDVVLRTGSAFRLGTRFWEWRPGGDFVHVFAPAGFPIDPVPFTSLWAVARRDGSAEPFDAYQAPSLLGRRDRFLPAGANNDPLLGAYGHGLQLRPDAYRAMVADHAGRLGARRSSAPFRGCATGSSGVTKLELDQGADLEADLYVDATNASARLIGRLSPAWDNWSRWLPADTIVHAAEATPAALPSLEHVVAMDGGWHLRAALPDRTRRALIYDRSALSDDRAVQLLRQTSGSDPASPHRFLSGRRPRSWIGNVVAIGEAAVALEPLEAVPMHILFSQIDRIVTTMPDCDFAIVELDHYNREAAEEADRIRDMLIAHYLLANRPEPFWRDRATMAPPPLLAETLALFAERGRLPIRDRESFSRDSWLAVLHGHGIVPRRLGPVAEAIDPASAARRIGTYLEQLELSVDRAPSHRAFLAGLARASG